MANQAITKVKIDKANWRKMHVSHYHSQRFISLRYKQILY